MSLVPCPKIIVREFPEKPDATRWRAWFAGLPLAPFRARTKGHAIAQAEAWWAARQAERAQALAIAAARAEASRRRAFA